MWRLFGTDWNRSPVGEKEKRGYRYYADNLHVVAVEMFIKREGKVAVSTPLMRKKREGTHLAS